MSAEIPSAPGGRKPAFGFAFFSAVTSASSFGFMIPILPNLVKSFTGGNTAHAAEWVVVFNTAGGLMSFFSGPVLGMLSDRLGRRPVLLISLFGMGVDFLVMAFAPSLWWLFIGRLISGATSGAFATASAYVADVVEPQNRARAFGLMGSAFSFGFVAGPAIGGWLGNYDLRWPFFASAALTLVNALYGLFIMPESLPPERRADQFDLRKANPVGALNLLRSHHELFGLSGVNYLHQLAQAVWPSVFVLYSGYRYHWTPAFTGTMMMIGGVIGVLVQSFVVGPAVKRFGERGCLLIGATAATCGITAYSLAPSTFWYICAMPLGALTGLVAPGLMGLMTARVSPYEQGQLQGAQQSIMGITGIIGPSIYGLSFAWAVDHPQYGVPGLPLMLAGFFTACALALAFAVAPRAPTAS
ncbi:MAG: TCR/Tet family MFS transporter [Caulobacteraceae bacterium]